MRLTPINALRGESFLNVFCFTRYYPIHSYIYMAKKSCILPFSNSCITLKSNFWCQPKNGRFLTFSISILHYYISIWLEFHSPRNCSFLYSYFNRANTIIVSLFYFCLYPEHYHNQIKVVLIDNSVILYYSQAYNVRHLDPVAYIVHTDLQLHREVQPHLHPRCGSSRCSWNSATASRITYDAGQSSSSGACFALSFSSTFTYFYSLLCFILSSMQLEQTQFFMAKGFDYCAHLLSVRSCFPEN